MRRARTWGDEAQQGVDDGGVLLDHPVEGFDRKVDLRAARRVPDRIRLLAVLVRDVTQHGVRLAQVERRVNVVGVYHAGDLPILVDCAP